MTRHRADSGKERKSLSHALMGTLIYFYGTFLLGFLQSIILICLAQSPYLVYIRIFLCVCMHLLAKMNFTKTEYG